MKKNLKNLREYLNALPWGFVTPGSASNKVRALLVNAWEEIKYSSIKEMVAKNICRAELIFWCDPKLSFHIDSCPTPTDVHPHLVSLKEFAVNVENGIIEHRRDLDRKEERTIENEITYAVFTVGFKITRRHDDPALEWLDQWKGVHVNIDMLFPDLFPMDNVEDSKLRFYDLLEQLLKPYQWHYLKGTRYDYEWRDIPPSQHIICGNSRPEKSILRC